MVKQNVSYIVRYIVSYIANKNISNLVIYLVSWNGILNIGCIISFVAKHIVNGMLVIFLANSFFVLLAKTTFALCVSFYWFQELIVDFWSQGKGSH